MATYHVYSTDPRKAKITAALRNKSGGNKVTLVKEIAKDGVILSFRGHCLKKCPIGAGYVSLGFFDVTPEEADSAIARAT